MLLALAVKYTSCPEYTSKLSGFKKFTLNSTEDFSTVINETDVLLFSSDSRTLLSISAEAIK